MQVTIKSKATGRELSFEKDFGATLAETAQIFGEDKTHQRAVAKFKIDYQNFGRSLLDAGLSDEEAVGKLNAYVPGDAVRGKSPLEKIMSLLGNLDAGQQAELKKLLGKK